MSVGALPEMKIKQGLGCLWISEGVCLFLHKTGCEVINRTCGEKSMC